MGNKFNNFLRLRKEMDDMYWDSHDKGLKIGGTVAICVLVVLVVVTFTWLNEWSDLVFQILCALTLISGLVAVALFTIVAYNVGNRHVQSRGRHDD